MHPFDRALVTGARDVEGIARLLAGLGLRVAPPPWPPLPLEPPGTLAACRVAARYDGLAAGAGPAPDASAADLARDVRRLAAATPGRRWLLVFHDPEFRWLTFVSPGVDGEVRRLEVRRHAPDAAALDALAEMAARPGDGATALALRHARAMARGRITARFFSEFRALRAALAAAWTGLAEGTGHPQKLEVVRAAAVEGEGADQDPEGARGRAQGKGKPEDAATARSTGAPGASGSPRATRTHAAEAQDRAELSLLLLCRLLFLHFLEACAGASFGLGGEGGSLGRLLERWLAAGAPAAAAGPAATDRQKGPRGTVATGTFYRTVLQPLFLDALGTPPQQRGREAEPFRHVPYLGGGLFARRPVERRHPDADLPDAAVTAVFDGLFARYRFTAAETPEAGGPAGIDPEMLGRVFEGLMDPRERGRTGTFYTPRAAVRSLAAAALESHLAAALADRRRAGPASPDAPATVRDLLAGRLPPPGEQAALLAALRDVRILDPAAGSGAFLLGALELLLELRRACGDPVDLATGVREALYGVDLKADAVLLCMLRLWLALAMASAAGVARPATAVGAAPAAGAGGAVGAADAGAAARTVAAGATAAAQGAGANAEPGAVAATVGAAAHTAAAGDPGAAAQGAGANAEPGAVAATVGAAAGGAGAATGAAETAAAASSSAGAYAPSLPNLDRRICQGDALFDPLEFATGTFADVPFDAPSARALRRIETLRDRYLQVPERERAALERELAGAERAVALAVLGAAARSLAGRLRELHHLASSRDLFGEPAARRTHLAMAAELERRLADVEDLRRRCQEEDEFPFFSFRLHFSEVCGRGGFDIVLTNPPWVRPHRWRASAGPRLRRRYAMLRRPAPVVTAAAAPPATASNPERAARVRGAAGAGSGPVRPPAPSRTHHATRVLDAAGAQGDLSLAFLERSLELLRPGGTLAMLLPAKLLRALYGAAARDALLARTTIVSVEDHALDQNAIFDADSFAAALVLRKAPAPSGHRVHVRVTRRGGAAADFQVEQAALRIRDEPGAPWALVPPAVAEALRAMQRSGARLGDELRIHRGVFTAANDVFLLHDAEAKLGGIVRARARSDGSLGSGGSGGGGAASAQPAGGTERAPASDGGWARGPGLETAPTLEMGSAEGILTPPGPHPESARGNVSRAGHAPLRSAGEQRGTDLPPDGSVRLGGTQPNVEIYVEGRVLRRAVRGAGIRAWRFGAPEHLLWLHAEGCPRPEPAPPLAAAYLERRRARLEARDGARRRPPGMLFRVSPAVARPKVMWQDLAARPAAVYARDPVRCADGEDRPVVPLNTVYFVVPPDDDTGHFLAALLNSCPAATYVRAVAERAKDARFRFLAWTMAALPLPAGWREAPEARALAELSRHAHAEQGLDEEGDARLTELVARLYGLDAAQLAALLEWDRWLAEAL